MLVYTGKSIIKAHKYRNANKGISIIKLSFCNQHYKKIKEILYHTCKRNKDFKIIDIGVVVFGCQEREGKVYKMF